MPRDLNMIDPTNARPTAKVNDIQGELRVDQYLTNFSVSWRQDQANFVAGFASTPIPVMNESDKYAIYPPGYFWRDEAEVRPLGGRPVQVRYKVESGQYLAEEWALEHTIDDRQRRNAAQPFNLDVNGVRLLEGKQLIREERIWATKFFKAGVWTHDVVGGTDFTPFNDAASDPIAFIDEMKDRFAQSTGRVPNTFVLGSRVKIALRSNPDIVDRIKYTERGVANDDVLAALFEVDRVRVVRSIYNAAQEGAEDDFEYIVDPNGAWLGYIEPTAGMDAPTAIARFGWTGLIPGSTGQNGGVITRGRDERAYSDWIHSRNAFDYKLVSPDLGVYFTNANLPTS
jgi:hypothetical protein